jgi:hypothetical protein
VRLDCKERPLTGTRNPRESLAMLPSSITFSAGSRMFCSMNHPDAKPSDSQWLRIAIDHVL